MKIPFTILPALLFPFLLGLGLGLAYSWLIAPVRVVNSEPIALRGDFKDQYRSAIAASYAGTGNLTRAQARLELLGDPDPIEALNAQAQRMLASGDPASAGIVAALASALETGDGVQSPTLVPPLPASSVVVNIPVTSTVTIEPGQPGTSIAATETPEPVVPTVPIESTPRPTHTAIPTAGAPFALTSQETVCDANLPDGLLQVMVFNADRRQMPGMEIRVTWAGGEDRFFTGLKPELGNGYADFIMTPDVVYSLQLGAGSDVASGIAAPVCQTEDGGTYLGGFKLIFQEPD